MKIDHVSVAGKDLEGLEEAFSEAGMKTEYGGPHSSGLTKMSLLGFEDGSYIELISKVGPDSIPAIWRRQIEQDGGACAWAIEVKDIAGEVAKARSLGIRASGPDDYSRRRPDGLLVKWQLGFLGEGEPGSLLPFLIKDETPREYRVRPSPSVSGGASTLSGIGAVIIGVPDIPAAARTFRSLYDWKEPEVREDIWEGVALARFSNSPVILASPRRNEWLSKRLAAFGASPCAYLISTSDFAGASHRYPLEQPDGAWFEDERMGWVAPLKRKGIMIGIVG